MKYILRIGIMILFIGFCACQKNEMPSETPTEIPPVTPAVALEVTETPVPTKQPEPASVSWITEMPQRKVKEYDELVESIPISEEYFSCKEFREVISEYIDSDKDGMLSRKERDAVKAIGEWAQPYSLPETVEVGSAEWNWLESFKVLFGSYESETKTTHFVLDGLEWFRNLETIRVYGLVDVTVCLENHPSVKSICSSYLASLYVYAKDCDELEKISVGEVMLWATVLNCPNIRLIEAPVYGYIHSLYCEGTPKLQIVGEVIEPCSVGTEAGVYPWSGKAVYNLDRRYEEDFPVVGALFEVADDGRPDFSNTDRFYTPIEWRDFEKLDLHLAELKTRLKELNEMSYYSAFSFEEDISTEERIIFFSPAGGSVYRVESWPMGEPRRVEGDRFVLHYYIVDALGEIHAFDTLEDVYTAADQMEELKNRDLKETVERLSQGY